MKFGSTKEQTEEHKAWIEMFNANPSVNNCNWCQFKNQCEVNIF